MVRTQEHKARLFKGRESYSGGWFWQCSCGDFGAAKTSKEDALDDASAHVISESSPKDIAAAMNTLGLEL